MKHSVYLLFFYLCVLIALPSVRAIKVQFGSNCSQSCSNDEERQCETGKFVMGLNFSPLQFVKTIYDIIKIDFLDFDKVKEKSFYEDFFISKYQNSIWHPPKQ